jgi:hypothetical protein
VSFFVAVLVVVDIVDVKLSLAQPSPTLQKKREHRRRPSMKTLGRGGDAKRLATP